MISNRPVPALLLLVALFAGITGCSEDLLNPGGETLITGQVVVSPVADPTRSPIFDLGVGITYQVGNVSAPGHRDEPAAAAAPLQGGGVTLGDPWPNPLTRPDRDPLRVVVTVGSSPVAGRVEVWGESRDFNFAVATLEGETLPAGATTYTWDGTETISGLNLPNGLYSLRVTVPADPGDPTVLETPVVLNRSVQEVIALDTFNTYTDPGGDFTIRDIAVGETFRGTSASGAFVGNMVLRDRVTLFADDVDFRHQEVAVDIARREVVRVTLELIPSKPLPPPDPALTSFARPGIRP